MILIINFYIQVLKHYLLLSVISQESLSGLRQMISIIW